MTSGYMKLGYMKSGSIMGYIIKAFFLVWAVVIAQEWCSAPETGCAAPLAPAASTELSSIPNWVIYPPDFQLVVIDAGHGGYDPGTQGYGLLEKDITLDIALRLNQLLQEAGINTYMIRQTDEYMDHRLRIETANEMDAALYLSIHCDWYEDSHYKGTQTFYSPENQVTAGGLNGGHYARLVQDSLIHVLGTTDRGLMEDPALSVLKRAHMPSVLVEVGFLSNPDDARRLGQAEFRQQVAEGLAEGVEKALALIEN